MRKNLIKHVLVFFLVLAAMALAGCCEHPDALKTAMTAMSTVQTVYDPLVSGYLSDQNNGTVKAGMLAADTLLALGGQLQAAKCATPEQAAQMQLQANEIAQVATQAKGN